MLEGPSTDGVFRLKPTVQTYDWGKRGYESKVVQLAAASTLQRHYSFDMETPYAELWMGTHVSSPSKVDPSQISLLEHLRNHPQLMGPKIIEKFDAGNGNLPFLFKVLSMEKALSVQTHPDKETAANLHRQFPEIYKDPNHKPEMVIALTPFTALCGFRPLPQIAGFLDSAPEFASLISPTILATFREVAYQTTSIKQKSALKSLFSILMTASSERVATAVTSLMERYSHAERVHENEKDLVELVGTLNSQFPGDIGIFCAFMLNFVKLEPGEAIFLGAGEPHAYISGDVMECMANSDNVIRAGLTPKLRDVPNLVANLTYNASGPELHIVKPSVFRDSNTVMDNRPQGGLVLPWYTHKFDPPAAEFAVLRMSLDLEHGEHTHKAMDGPSLCIITEGSGLIKWSKAGDGIDDHHEEWNKVPEEDKREMALRRGDVFFVGAGWEVSFRKTGFHPLVMFRAFVTTVSNA